MRPCNPRCPPGLWHQATWHGFEHVYVWALVWSERVYVWALGRRRVSQPVHLVLGPKLHISNRYAWLNLRLDPRRVSHPAPLVVVCACQAHLTPRCVAPKSDQTYLKFAILGTIAAEGSGVTMCDYWPGAAGTWAPKQQRQIRHLAEV